MVDAGTIDDYVIVEAGAAEEVAAIAATHGVRVEPVPAVGLEPVTTVTLALVGSVTAVATVARLVDQHKGGQVIDLRPGSPRPVYRSRDVVHGLVVVITHSGVVRVEVLEPQGMFGTVCKSLVSALPELTGAGAAEVVRKIDGDHGGDGVSVTVEDPDGPSTP